MRDIAIVSFAQFTTAREDTRNEVEMLMPVVAAAVERSGIGRKEIGFTCSGSCDYFAGMPFSFVGALDAIGAWPPIEESHVEQDAAWALYEAWVRLQIGDIDSALVYGFARTSPGDLDRMMAIQLDPYYEQPLWPPRAALAALQARALIDAGKLSEKEMAEVVARAKAASASNPHAVARDWPDGYASEPLRGADCPPVTDGAAAVVLAADDLARRVCSRPVWIAGIDHRAEPHLLGCRDLTASPSAALAASEAGVGNGPVDLAELHAPYSYQELVLREAMGLPDGVEVNPSGGALGADPVMVTGLIRIGEAATGINERRADRAVAHATSGPCLQHNLVCVLEARP